MEDLLRQASAGSVGAMIALGEIFEQGEKAPQDYVKALSWYDKAARKGSAEAQRALGAMFELGKGVVQNPEFAAYWYARAADQGMARAQTNLGILYETGEGVPQDYDKALYWYDAAALQGYARGQVHLGLLYEKGTGVPRDYGLAHHWYAKAAESGYTRGQLHLGSLYEQGHGVPQDYAKSLALYEKAARQGYAPAKEALADLRSRMDMELPASSEQHPARIEKPTPPPHAIPEETAFFVQEIARYEMRRSSWNLARKPGHDVFLARIMSMECSDHNLPFLEERILAAKSIEKASDAGVRFETDYRFKEGDVDAEKNRAYLGLSWDILNMGYLENKSQARRYEYESQVAKLRGEQDRCRELFSCRDVYLIQHFNRLKYNIQKRRHDILSHYFTLMRKAYFLGNILNDDLLKAEYELKKSEEILRKYESQELHLVDDAQLDPPEAPMPLKLDLDALSESIRTDPSYMAIASLEKKNLKEKYDSLYDKQLKFYVHGGVQDDEDGSGMSGGDITAGVHFTLPLRQNKTDLLSLEIRKAEAGLKKERETILNEVTRLHNAYGEKVTDLVQMRYREHIATERIRRSLIEMEETKESEGYLLIEDYRPLVNHLQELLDVRFEYLAVLEGMYRHLLHTLTLAKVPFREEFIRNVRLELPLERGRYGKRALYVWSKAFNALDGKEILDILQAKGIKTVILSFPKRADRQRTAHFIERSKFAGIEVELMASSNEWIQLNKMDEAAAAVKDMSGFSKRIHLDIEPHTLDDYDQNRETYEKSFLRLLEKIGRVGVKDMKLSVSLPLHMKESFIERVANDVDLIYVMAYGIHDVGKLEQRMKPYQRVSPDKLVLALRPADFTDELDLEKFVEETMARLGIDQFAFHHIEQFIELTGRTLP